MEDICCVYNWPGSFILKLELKKLWIVINMSCIASYTTHELRNFQSQKSMIALIPAVTLRLGRKNQ